jgi:hypothetical protein
VRGSFLPARADDRPSMHTQRLHVPVVSEALLVALQWKSRAPTLWAGAFLPAHADDRPSLHTQQLHIPAVSGVRHATNLGVSVQLGLRGGGCRAVMLLQAAVGG